MPDVEDDDRYARERQEFVKATGMPIRDPPGLMMERNTTQVPEKPRSNSMWGSLLVLASLCVYLGVFGNRLYFDICSWQRWRNKESLGGIIFVSGMILIPLPAFLELIRDILIRNPAKRKRHLRGYRVALMILWLGVLSAIVGLVMMLYSHYGA